MGLLVLVKVSFLKVSFLPFNFHPSCQAIFWEHVMHAKDKVTGK
jgi:hypothetical protein